MPRTHNTAQEGSATVLYYPQQGKYIGVCLELDIVDEDEDVTVLKHRMMDRVESYVRYVCENKKGEQLLNRPAPDKYWEKAKIYARAFQNIEQRSTLRSATPAVGVSLERIPLRPAMAV